MNQTNAPVAAAVRNAAAVRSDAREALQGEGLSFEAATAAVTAIARGAVPHIRVTY